MIDPVTGFVRPNGMQDVRALGMTGSNPFLAPQMHQMAPEQPVAPQPGMSPVPPGAQSLGGGIPPAMPAAAPGPSVPPAMPGQANGAMPAAFGHLPPGLLHALLQLSQRNPSQFGQRMQGPLAQNFGITPEMVQGAQQPAQGFGQRIGMGNSQGFAPPQGGGFDPASLAAQSQLGMGGGQSQARNQNLGSTPAY